MLEVDPDADKHVANSDHFVRNARWCRRADETLREYTTLCRRWLSPIKHFESADDPAYFCADPKTPGFINVLGQYQYVVDTLKIDRDVANKILELSGGIPRLIIALWIAAHRVALESPNTDSLTLKDFERAANTYLAPVKPAIAALRSKDPRQIARFEDLMPIDDNFWASFWTTMSRL